MAKGGDEEKSGGGDGNSLKVFIRVRPMERRENMIDLGACLSVDTKNKAIIMKAKPENKVFTFDQVADVTTTQETVFSSMAKNIIDSCISGYNGTIFAYGQTGSGKTFTMVGPSEDEGSFHHELRGIIPRSFEYLFSLINRQKELLGERVEFLCRASFLEIYNEHLSDLLDAGGGSPQLRENIKRGVIVEGLIEQTVATAADAYLVLQDGWKNRRVAETAMNRESSRSHAVFTLNIESKENRQGIWQIKASRLNLVDLAGSERQKDTKTTGSRLKEGCSINKSLSALGNVIMSLDGKCRHIPYRDSKLTFLLRESLGGNAQTHIIACVNPTNTSFGETLSTLQFARRAKQIKNKAVVNQNVEGDITMLQAELKRLKEELMAKDRMLAEIGTDGVGTVASQVVATGPWREHFLESMRLYEVAKAKIKLNEEKQDLLEAMIKQKEKNLLQTKMVLRFRTETVKRFEEQLKQKMGDPNNLVACLREEISTLETMAARAHKLEALATDRQHLEGEVEALRLQLKARSAPEEHLLQIFKEALSEKGADPRSSHYPSQQPEPEETTASHEKLKSQNTKLQEELDAMKKSHSKELEQLSEKLMNMESELVKTQAVKQELEKSLKMTQERAMIERENHDKLHMDTLKTITTPKKAKGRRWSRSFGRASADSSPCFDSPIMPDAEGLQQQEVPANMLEEQVDGLTMEIQSLTQENADLNKRLQQLDTKIMELFEEKSGLQSKNNSMQQKMATDREVLEEKEKVISTLQKDIKASEEKADFFEGKLRDIELLAEHTYKNLTELRQERDHVQASCSTFECQVSSLASQLEESERKKDDISLALSYAKEENEIRQNELSYLQSQQKTLESRLQEEREEHSQTKNCLQMLQIRYEEESRLAEQLKDQLHEQGSEKEQELLSLLDQKRALETDLNGVQLQCTALEQQVKQVQSELGTAKASATAQEKARKDLEEALRQVSAERNQLRQGAKTKQAELEHMQTTIEELEQQLEAQAALQDEELMAMKEEKDSAVFLLEQKLEERENKLFHLQAQSDLLQDDLDEIKFMNDELISRTQGLEAENLQGKKHIECLEEDKVKFSDQITKLHNRVVQGEDELAEQKRMYELMLKEREAQIPAQDLQAQLQAEHDELLLAHREKVQELRKTREDISVLSGQLQILEKQRQDDRDAQATELEKLAQVANERLQESEKWKEVASVGQSLIDSANKRNSELELLVSQRDITLAEMQKVIQKSKEDLLSVKRLEDEIQRQNEAVENLQRDNTDKTDQLQRMRLVASKDHETISKLTSDLAELEELNRHNRQETEDLRERLSKAQGEAAKLAGHSNLNQKIHYMQQLKDQNQQLICENSHLESQNIKLDAKVAQLSSRLKELQPEGLLGKSTPSRTKEKGSTPGRQPGASRPKVGEGPKAIKPHLTTPSKENQQPHFHL